MKITILHVEDEPVLAKLVHLALTSFGFSGTILSADRVQSALELLGELAHKRQPVELIITDMQLPDGTGLDVVRAVRADPYWRLTPIIVLSGETAPGVVSRAYALGANCYLPKSGKDTTKTLRSLYECWIENAILPSPPTVDRVQEALSRAVNFRARTSGIFLRLADLAIEDPVEMRFWLERSMSEGNLSNLLELFRHKINETDFPSAAIERLAEMHASVDNALSAAENCLQTTFPDAGRIYRMALDLAEVMDEEIMAESLGYLFPKSPTATMALKERAAAHFNALATHILERTEEPEIRQRAEALRSRAGRMDGALEEDHLQESAK
ncbi:MAG TPA: response regulator [Dongiaceae bacterium]|nr:response regulator [Dongiaceae bacterium]